MKGQSPYSIGLSDCIPQNPTYPTDIRLLSLIDTCIHYLIHHPEISISSLPSDLHEHIQKRKDDSFYRVLPEYSIEKRRDFSKPLNDHLIRLQNTDGKDNKITIAIEVFRYLDDHIDSLRYLCNESDVIKQKLIKFPKEGFPSAISQQYLLKWFNYKLETS